MKARACVRKECGAIFLFLAMTVLIYLLYNMEILEIPQGGGWGQLRHTMCGTLTPDPSARIQTPVFHLGNKSPLVKFHQKVNTTVIIPRVSTDLNKSHSFCTFQPLSTEDAVEESLLLDSIAWPETPPLPSPVSLEQTSDPAHSTFTILPRRGGGQWQVGDQLEVMIKISDLQSCPKKYGGDFLLARLHNLKLGAGVAGHVVDHLNGSYSAVFSLPWEGDAQVEVTLVHSSEAITVLRRLTREHPDRINFRSLFRSGSLSESSICNVCLRPTQQPLCNYTDLRTGEPWFCYKPKALSCNARIDHAMGEHKQHLKEKEEKLFQSGVNTKVFIWASGPATVTVLPKKEGQPEVKSSNVTSGPCGYYYQDVWRALGSTAVHQFNTSAISQCLKGKVVHMYGDSTVRQFFEYLTKTLPDLKEFDLHSPQKAGPYMALDYANNIFVKYRFHGPPIRIVTVPTRELRYIANELDDITGGTNTVVLFCVWAHFGTFPMEIYIRRLQSIRRAVVRLLDRAPGTVVIIRTGNPKDLPLLVSLSNSDWHSLQCNKVLRLMFKGLNVHLIDAWEMVLAHHLPHNLHPPPSVIKNMINVILSYICPQKGG
ncbi:NXPE family member 3-like isoform X1 [Epinephelus moara]|uniref:NXPE family member 3-like isoform X1 n=1 Tax=Epinephelus moara TaxID=300413 RepID=UPI00214E2A94|nr:NXPE family member 3-like isoform X1 [Epinephelus moara]XP_049892759.1 NXPE family member 3-like isoform X1 [Epinephelus moara]XP_049892760.1 NXPE family member 3-like isoform X1 [Epinephelus moara]XP_049892761.1 NXPE family member 3-like isoform X1 [Epinephelus moara]XP_049892762.1 NXPE family member 3-like isoform X1 [Epinephelus moara]XP_049892763.1 NXPE family member 3-like isoform X1 [Epinephelus moara]XP_049892764.1 NXPE family member 3-like isoform X1 [Epinephelus moara]XP_04989276